MKYLLRLIALQEININLQRQSFTYLCIEIKVSHLRKIVLRFSFNIK